MITDPTKIEPCPICGSEGVIIVYAPELCGCSTECPMQSQPIAVWNRLSLAAQLQRTIKANATREGLAEYAHAAWAGWMRYLFAKGAWNTDGTFTINSDSVARWQRQMNTAYADLPESEKRSDRNEADRMLAIVVREVPS